MVLEGFIESTPLENETNEDADPRDADMVYDWVGSVLVVSGKV